MSILIVSIAVFGLILFSLVLLRLKTGNKFEIKNSDIILALIPVVLWLLLTGKIQKFQFGGLGIETAFVKASQSAIEPQVISLVSSKLPVEPVPRRTKGAVAEIPTLVEEKTEALIFRLGHGGYVGSAIEEYFDELLKFPFLKYVIIEDEDQKLVGIINAHMLASVLLAQDSRYRYYTSRDFAHWINASLVQRLASLPGFVSAENAINEDVNKQSALERMESLNVETLPVIDEEGRFVGIVDRSRLTTSLIIDVADQIR